MNDNVLGTEKVSSLFFKYAIPAVLSMILVGSQNIINGIFLGKFAGANALASVSLASPYVQIASAISIVIAFGTLSIIGRALGSNSIEEAQDAFKTALYLILSISIVYGGVGAIFTEEIANLLGADKTIAGGVISYIRIISFFLPAYPLMVLMGFTDRIIGKPNVFFNASLVGLIVNTVLNYVFIVQMNLELVGAALATGISFYFGLAIVAVPLLSKKSFVNVFSGKMQKNIIGRVLYNGASEGIGSSSDAIATFLFNLEFMRIAGPAGVASFTAINYIMKTGVRFIFGIGDGMTPIVSYNYGQKKYDRVDQALKWATGSGIAVGLFIFGVLFFMGEPLVKIFVKDNQNIIEMATQGSRLLAFAFIFNGINIIHSLYFTALGKAGASAIVALCRGIVGIFIGINVLKLWFGTNGVWLTVPVTEMGTMLVVFALVRLNPLAEKMKFKTAVKS